MKEGFTFPLVNATQTVFNNNNKSDNNNKNRRIDIYRANNHKEIIEL